MVKGKIVAIIPARGGSKRIPKKNIIDLHGKPMIAWTIEAALQSRYIDRVVVSTDDEEIAEVSRKYGAEVPFLRAENNDDFSTVSMATIGTVKQLEALPEFSSEIIVQLMANCPARTSADIDDAVENFISKNIDFQISSFKYGWMNPWWAHKIDENNLPVPVFSEIGSARSQDLPELFCPTGAIWIAVKDQLIREGTFYGKDFSFFQLPWKKAVDIDDYEDLEMAEFIMRTR